MRAKNKKLEEILQEKGVDFSVVDGVIIVQRDELDLGSNQITNINGFKFKRERLDLDNNQITSLKRFSFEGSVLYLNSNQITSLKAFSFEGELLDLDNNQITSLKRFSFEGKRLYLNNNQITSLNGFKFEGERLWLYNNPINSKVEECGMFNRTIYSYQRGNEKICIIGCRHATLKEAEQAINEEYEGEAAEKYIEQVKKSLSLI